MESLRLNCRASERGIRRSEILFLLGTQNFLFVPRSWQEEKHLSRYHKLLTKKIVKHVQAHIKKSLICSLCRVKAFEEKLNGYNKEVESFRKKEASLNFTIKLILNTLNYYKFIF